MDTISFVNRKAVNDNLPNDSGNIENTQQILLVEVDSRPTSPDSLAKLLPELLDGPTLPYADKSKSKSKSPLVLPSNPYIYGGIAALTTFAYGFNAGIIAVVLGPVQAAWSLPKDSYFMAFIVSSMLLGAVLGSFLPRWLGSDRLGRKTMLLVTNGILSLGAFGSFLCQGPIQLIICRGIIGVGIGIGSIMPGLYITEMSPASIRGFLGILNQFSGFVGVLASYCAGLIFSELHWQQIFLLSGVMALLSLACSAFMLPESPRWLISRGSNNEAMRVLIKIYGRQNEHHANEEYEKIYSHLSRVQSENPSLPRKKLFIIIALQLIQQAAGAGFVTYYSASIFRAWGLSAKESTLATILSALPQLLVFGAVAKWAEAWGRKRLLIISEIAMAAVLFYMSAVTFIAGPGSLNRWQALLIFIGLAAHRVAYALGLAPVPTVLIGELLPFSLRSHGLAVALTTNWLLNFAITSLIPLAAALNSLSLVYLVMAIFSLLSIGFIRKHISETRGIVLDAMEEVNAAVANPPDSPPMNSTNQIFTSIPMDSKLA